MPAAYEGDGNSSNQSPSKSQTRRYGFACSNCRRRKAKCDGAFPVCKKCVSAREKCTYEKGPSVAYTVALQHQLKEYQERFEQLRATKDEERDELLAKPIAAEQPRGGKARALSPSAHAGNFVVSKDLNSNETNDLNGIQEETSIGTDGQVCFYGKTSLYHINTPEGQRDEVRDSHDIAQEQPRFEEQNDMASFLSELSSPVLNDLLEDYWCWPHHLHCVLVKKLFLRDLNTLGRYVSPFLLSAVLAQAARYSTRADAAEIGDRLAKRALELLLKAIDQGSALVTVQGLLILSARECGFGRTSQGWLYSGMAFRMARDLGVHIAPTKLGPLSSHFSAEELALRQQLFWSCYTWDKTMSLCLGRPPSITQTIELPTPETLLDGHEADDEVWEPVPSRMSRTGSISQHRSLSSTRFAAYCSLCIIIHDILEKLYSRPYSAHRESMLTYLDQTLNTLDTWLSSLSRELVISESTRLCPPLHVLLLNLLHHAAVILVCRPYRAVSPVAKARCTAAASMIDALFTLHVKRFGFRCITWLQTYTAFVACTINVRDLKESSKSQPVHAELAQEASARLNFGLEILRQTGSTPSAGRCAAIIEQLLHAEAVEPDKQTSKTTSLNQDSTASDTNVHSRLSLVEHNQQVAGSFSNTERNGEVDSTAIQNRNQHFSSDLHSEQNNSILQLNRNRVDRTTFDTGLPSSYDCGPMLGGGDIPGQSTAFLDPLLPKSGMETPFRWLPENISDDGSWMLMDLEFQSG